MTDRLLTAQIFTSILGFLAGVWSVSSILIAISVSPWFSWISNALSDLGVSPAALIFNQGLIVGGCFSLIFSLFYYNNVRGSIGGRVGVFFLILASISLIGIGVFTEYYVPHHFVFSVLFFVFVLFAFLSYGAGCLFEMGCRWLGVYCIIFGVIGIIAWALPVWDGVAIPEAITAFPAAFFIAVLGLKNLLSYIRK
ncbi:MAG: DUF998 domain-containing protein [Candidatus Odinarchaeum yellowstonii]|uniref:DUF998 domain-containing protein n=1 Tax=Odinarchaeota yellowstonii (strain LCB_4) TaxID=1841599 RepID=A0AAF0D1X9_ODILC|nr:MAG: DUF998 domain-containing protein [Candidatus Odinarchaeum yellowstonii]